MPALKPAGKLSKRSLEILASCHQDIQTVVREVIELMDVSVVEGYRDQAAQDAHFAAGRSRVRYPLSKHNCKPSLAVHLLPYPEGWKASKERWYYMGGLVMGVADILYKNDRISRRLVWGGDWNSNDLFTDQTFHDLAHFELG